jgi:hypothetical protein
MSATMHPYMPTIGNPSPWEQALATTKQDTGGTLGGGGWSAPSTQVPYSAPSTMGGGTWNLPDWAWGGNQKGASTYNQQTGQWDPTGVIRPGDDIFGVSASVGYDPRQDRGGLNLSGNNVETFWSRMLRFGRESGLPPDQAMRAALDRIRRDNGGTLAGTGFDEGGGSPGQTGGSTVAGYTQYPGQEGGAGGARPGQALPSGTSSPNGGTSHASVPGLGTMGGDPLYNYGLALNGTAQDRARLIGEANGRTSPAHGRLAEFATNLYANALKAYLMISQLGGGGGAGAGTTGVGDMNSFLAAMGGQGMIPLLQAGIGKGLGGDLGQDPETQEQAYRAALALRSIGDERATRRSAL